MIHIKVIRASHLAIGLAVASLIVALALILLGMATREGTADALTVSEAREAAALPASVPAQTKTKGRILIYHSHTHEAYAQTPSDPYEEVSAWRTQDETHSVVKVGECLCDLLRDMGYEVVHDTADYEQDDLGTAYQRSLAALTAREEPFDLYLDLHRDAYSGSGDQRALTQEGTSYARVMILLGTGDNFKEKPDYAGNLAFARAFTGAMNRLLPDSCRSVMTKSNRYNQHIGTPAVLLEVGHNENTLSEALNILPYVAKALDEAM